GGRGWPSAGRSSTTGGSPASIWSRATDGDGGRHHLPQVRHAQAARPRPPRARPDPRGAPAPRTRAAAAPAELRVLRGPHGAAASAAGFLGDPLGHARRVIAAATALLLVGTPGVRAGDPPLQALARHVGATEGVFARAADGTVLVSQAAARAVHPASVSKVATSLALVDHLGAGYRFETRVLARGPLHDRRLAGDLVIEAGRDPFLVYESA